MALTDGNVIQELENMSQILLAPPNLVTVEQRRAAESVFINFQKSKAPFELCRVILESSKVEYVHFQAASLLKNAVIREWSQLTLETRESLRSYLLQYVMRNPGLASYVREQLVLVVAIMVKRSGVELGPDVPVVENIFLEVSQLISSGNPSLQTIGCSILTALLNEYSSTTRSSDVGLTWEVHLLAKKKFETTDLKKIFQYCLQGLSEFTKLSLPIGHDASALLKKFLLIAEQVLTWNFQFSMLLPRKLIGLFEAQQYPTLRPTSEWKEVLLQSSIVELFFKLHWQLRSIPDLCHHTLQCINQLASLNGALMNNEDDRKLYLSWFMDGLLKMLIGMEVYEYEALNLSNIISRFGLFFPPTIMSTLPAEVLQTYVAQLTRLTCVFTENAAKEEALHKDSQIYMEAFEHILDAWMTLIQDVHHFPPDSIRQGAIQIFNHYLQCHIAPPDGTRNLNADDVDNKEVEEIEEDDRTKFKDQLAVIGLLGRQMLDHCIPLLTKLLEDRVSRLHGQMQRIQQESMTVSDSAILETLNEDIHWLVMIIGHVLCPISEGETALIPMEVTRYCIQQSASVSMDTTLRVLASPGHRVADIPGAEQSSDNIVRVIASVMRMCEVEKRALQANLMHLLSPELGLTLVWFIQRWAVTYLLPNESYYSELSMTLTAAFGRDSEAGLWTLNFLLEKLEINLCIWGAEPKLATETAITLVAILNNVERGNRAVTCEGLNTIIKKQSTHSYSSLPTAARKAVLKALVIVGTANKDSQKKDQYWNDLLKPLQDRFQNVLYNDTFQQTFQTEAVKSQVLDLIECFIGVADGCTIQNLPRLFPFLLPIMNELVKLVDIYHNYSNVVGSVFQFFCTAAKRILFFLNQDESKALYKCCLNMIQIYAKHNAGLLSREANAEEEQYLDILTLMQLLSDLLSKDFIDFSPRNPIPRLIMGAEGPQVILNLDNNNDERDSTILAADVALSGLHIIMPMMTSELLKFPSLCLQYYKLVTFICEIYPNKICVLPPDLFKMLLMSVQLGLNSFTAEVTNLSLDFLSVLGEHVKRHNMEGQPVFLALEPFLKLVFDMVVLESLDSALTLTATSTLFTLICCFQEKFKELVEVLIREQTDPVNAQRLVEAFNELTQNINFNMDRQNRALFKNKCEKFITNVRGFLCVK